MISERPVNSLASRIAISSASLPELVKNDCCRLPGVSAANSRARRTIHSCAAPLFRFAFSFRQQNHDFGCGFFYRSARNINHRPAMFGKQTPRHFHFFFDTLYIEIIVFGVTRIVFTCLKSYVRRKVSW